MTKSILLLFCVSVICYSVKTSDITRKGLSLRNVRDVGNSGHTMLRNKQKRDAEEASASDFDGFDWAEVFFDTYEDEENRTVVLTEDSEITVTNDGAEDGGTSSREGRKLQKLIATDKIPDTELFTGVFYKLSMKGLPRGWVTLSNEQQTSNNFNYLQVDMDPGSLLNHYGKNGSKEFANEWMLAPTELPGWYTLISRSRPKSLTTWCGSKLSSTGEHTCVAESANELFKLQPGGQFREDAFFVPVSTDEKNYYKLQMKTKAGYVTWSTSKNGPYNNYVQISSEDFGEDSKFKFTPGSVILDAKVYDFKYTDNAAEQFKSKKTETVLETIDADNNSSASIERTFGKKEERKSTWSFGFKENLEWASSVSVELSAIPLVSKATATASFKAGFEANQQKTVETTQTFSFDIKITVPPNKHITGSAYYEWVKDIELPFTATMAVTGKAQRLVDDGSGTISAGPVDASFVEEFLKSSDETYTNMRVSPNDKNVFLVDVSGTLKGAMGSKTIIALNDVPPGTKIYGNKAKPAQ